MTRVVWFHPRQLVPPRGGGDHRTLGLVTGMLAAGHEILLVAPDDELPGRVDVPQGLLLAGLRTRRGLAGAVSKVVSRDPLRSPRPTLASVAEARAAITAFEPDVAVVSEVMAWALARRLLPAVPWVYDSQNVERDLFQGHLDSTRGAFERLTFRVDLRRVSAAERALLGRSAATLVVSKTDAGGLRTLDPTAQLVLAPSSMPAPVVPCDPGAAEPVVLFVGTLDFPPNVAAVDLLATDVLPRVRERVPRARLLVVGRRPTGRVRDLLSTRPWAELWEDAPDIADAYARARCVVMPFTSGSGTKLKVYEAMAFGLPVVATARAVRGVDIVPGVDVLVAEDSAALADLTVDLLSDPEAARRLGRTARAAFDERLSWEQATFPQVDALLRRLSTDR